HKEGTNHNLLLKLLRLYVGYASFRLKLLLGKLNNVLEAPRLTVAYVVNLIDQPPCNDEVYGSSTIFHVNVVPEKQTIPVDLHALVIRQLIDHVLKPVLLSRHFIVSRADNIAQPEDSVLKTVSLTEGDQHLLCGSLRY